MRLLVLVLGGVGVFPDTLFGIVVGVCGCGFVFVLFVLFAVVLSIDGILGL